MVINHTFFLISVLVGGILTLVGFITYLYPPKKINYFYGYRTSRSMKSQESWDFAQKYSSKLSCFLGITMVAIGFLLKTIDIEKPYGLVIALLFMLMIFIILLFKTENALKKHFPNE